MANQRHPNQRLVAFALDAQLLTALERARKQAGKNRSDYIREAIVEKLQRQDAALPEALKDAPDRTGKTYRPREIKSYREEARTSSKPASALADAVKKASAQHGSDPAI